MIADVRRKLGVEIKEIHSLVKFATTCGLQPTLLGLLRCRQVNASDAGRRVGDKETRLYFIRGDVLSRGLRHVCIRGCYYQPYHKSQAKSMKVMPAEFYVALRWRALKRSRALREAALWIETLAFIDRLTPNTQCKRD